MKIKNSEIEDLLGAKKVNFPKYTTQILNLANRNSQGTTPKVVGQMSELIKQFSGKELNEWEEWYKKKYPESIKNATDKAIPMVKKLKEAIAKIDDKLIKEWVEDLIIVKTFSGLKFQEAILKKISKHLSKPYRLSNPKEEAKGIDGYIGKIPVSIKPDSFKHENNLNEEIDFKIIFYSKKKDGLTIEFNLD